MGLQKMRKEVPLMQEEKTAERKLITTETEISK